MKLSFVIHSPHFMQFLSKLNGFGVAAFVTPFFIFTKYKRTDWDKYRFTHESWWKKKVKWYDELINHEQIHHYDMYRWLIIGFYVIYGAEYLYYRLIANMSHYDAYMSISFERRAYKYESDLTYLDDKRLFGIIKMK